MTQQALTQQDALAILRWYQDIGVTDVVADELTDLGAGEFSSAAAFLKPAAAPAITASVPQPETQNTAQAQPQQSQPQPSITDSLIPANTPAAPIGQNEPLGTAEASLDARRLASEAKTLDELKTAMEIK